MPKPRKGERVLGPYRYRDRFRVVLVAGDGSREDCYFAKEATAEVFAEQARLQIHASERTTETALDEYEDYLRDVKGNKPDSIKRTRWAVGKFFPSEVAMFALRPKLIEKRYAELVEKMAVDSHRGALAETKTFLDWCVSQKWIGKNPATDVKGQGRRNKGKTQLRFRDLRRWFKVAVSRADDGDEGALAALLTVVLGMRCGEIVALKVGDLDELDAPGDTLHVADAKTKAGVRSYDVPDILCELLLAQCEGKGDSAQMFPARGGKAHWRDWPRAQVLKLCKAAKVPPVTAHAMRGANATVALRQGAAAALVAASLGHEDVRTTLENYAEPGAADAASRERLHKALVN